LTADADGEPSDWRTSGLVGTMIRRCERSKAIEEAAGVTGSLRRLCRLAMTLYKRVGQDAPRFEEIR
jgi:hypothetical protein